MQNDALAASPASPPSVQPFTVGFRMPKAALGLCLYRLAPASPPIPAIITEIGTRSVSLIAFPNGTQMLRRDGVRHITDPDLARMAAQDGCWEPVQIERDLTMCSSLYLCLSNTLIALERRVQSLEAALTMLKDELGAK